MTERAFTPAPWSPLINSTVSLESGIESIIMDGGCAQVRSCNSKADAHLISAAPLLYGAVEIMLARYTELVNSGDCGFWDPEAEFEVLTARAALRKAQGIVTEGQDAQRLGERSE